MVNKKRIMFFLMCFKLWWSKISKNIFILIEWKWRIDFTKKNISTSISPLVSRSQTHESVSSSLSDVQWMQSRSAGGHWGRDVCGSLDCLVPRKDFSKVIYPVIMHGSWAHYMIMQWRSLTYRAAETRRRNNLTVCTPLNVQLL